MNGSRLIMRHDAIPLSEAPVKEGLKIVQIMVETGMIGGLSKIGISPGSSIRIRKISSGWVIWNNERRGFAKISDKLAQCIMVTPKRSRFHGLQARIL